MKSVADPENTVSFHHSEINMVKLNVLGRNKSLEGHSIKRRVRAFRALGWFLKLFAGHLAKISISVTAHVTLLSLKVGVCFRDLSLLKSLYLHLNY